MENFLEIKNLSIRFFDFFIDSINLSVKDTEFLVILGQSGSGKSTLIRAIAGLEEIEDGEIILNKNNLKYISIHKRNIGMVFQDLALFSHLNVHDNIAFGLKIRGWDAKSIKKRVEILLKAMKMEGYEKRDISVLSGGEKQRVALARTLAVEPELILFDEPLSSLDNKLRKDMIKLIKEIQKRLDFTAIFVTHDREEAFELADRIAVLQNGKLIQIDFPDNIYLTPKNQYVAKLLGITNFFYGTIVDLNKGIYFIKMGDFILKAPYREGFSINDKVVFCIRESAGYLSKKEFGLNVFEVKIIEDKNIAGERIIVLEFANEILKLRTNRSFWNNDNNSNSNLLLHIPLEGISLLEKV